MCRKVSGAEAAKSDRAFLGRPSGRHRDTGPGHTYFAAFDLTTAKRDDVENAAARVDGRRRQKAAGKAAQPLEGAEAGRPIPGAERRRCARNARAEPMPPIREGARPVAIAPDGDFRFRSGTLHQRWK